MKNLIMITVIFLGNSWGYYNATVTTLRTKRVLWGKELRQRNTEYSSVLYFTWLGVGHECPTGIRAKVASLLNEQCRIRSTNLICGGTLITPDIVLTSAHCLAKHHREWVDEVWSTFTIRSHWENLMNVIAGYSDISIIGEYHGVSSSKFLVHQRYGIFHENRMSTHDYGWIVLSNSYPNLSNKHVLAPLYNLGTLAAVYQKSTTQQWACLFIGFGKYELNSRASKILRHGWGMLQQYYDTYDEMKTTWFANLKDFPFKYRDYATWSWMRNFGKQAASVYSGDSGAPVSCSNYHSGVTAAQVQSKRDHTKISIVHSLAFLPYEESSEYRRAFVEAIKVFKNSGTIPTFDQTFTPVPDTTQQTV